MRASRSSTARSTANGAASPLSPRPQRSKLKTVKHGASSAASGAPADLSLNAPPA
jgi:hypothetical protein